MTANYEVTINYQIVVAVEAAESAEQAAHFARDIVPFMSGYETETDTQVVFGDAEWEACCRRADLRSNPDQ